MKAIRCTAQSAIAVLRDFCEAWGAEQIERSYRWKHPPEQLVGGERFYRYTHPADPTIVAGWGSLTLNTRDATDEEAALSVGVFPDHQRKGYRKAILDDLAARASKLGAARVGMIVFKNNEAHFKRTMREAHAEGSPWIYAGDVWEPAPGYGYFVRHLRGDKA